MSTSSPNTSQGTVPDRLLVVMKAEEQLSQVIDGVEYKAKAKPTFFTDADGNTNSAMSWGMVTTIKERCKFGVGYTYNYFKPKTKTIKNKPFTNVRLWTIHERDGGGRAYKFIDKGGHYFDIRENVFLEALYNDEVKTVNGVVCLTGEYIWVKAMNQMRVARVGSLTHKELLDTKRRNELKKIPAKDLVIGGVYEDRAGKMYAYVGRLRDNNKKLCWVFVGISKPHIYEHDEDDIKEWKRNWTDSPLQDKFDHERNIRRESGCAELYSTGNRFVKKIGEVDLGKDTAETLQWFHTTYVDGKWVRG